MLGGSALTLRRYHCLELQHRRTPSSTAAMKLSWGFILSSLYCSAAASKAGHVFIYDPIVQPAKEEPAAVSPETARLILAQRLGVSRYHSINTADADDLLQLARYAGVSRRLFLGQDDLYGNEAHVLVWVEDVDDIGGWQNSITPI